MKICPECGKENRDKSFCTGCGHDIRNVETEEDRIKREEQEQQLERERKEREQKQKLAEIERKEREQKEKQLELERKEREQKRKQAEIERKEREQKQKKVVVEHRSYKEPKREKSKGNSRLKIIGILIIIIILLSGILYFQIKGSDNQVIPDFNSDDADSNLFSFVDSPNLKTVDFNGLFKMDVNGSSTFHEVPPHDAWYVSEQWNNDVNDTGYAFDGYTNVYYWKNTNMSEVVSTLSGAYHNPIYEDNIVILESFSHSSSSSSFYDYLVGTQSDDGEVVFVMGSDLDLLKTYANSIVFE